MLKVSLTIKGIILAHPTEQSPKKTVIDGATPNANQVTPNHN